jgi:large subunit ribosomal protein L21
MYAVVKVGGRQVRVTEGSRVLLDRSASAKPGDAFELTEVLVVGDGQGSVAVGTPTVAGAKVSGKVIGERGGEKLVVFKKRRRKNSKRKNGHRQKYTAVKIEKIEKP